MAADESSWRTTANCRQCVVAKIEEAIRSSGMPTSKIIMIMEMESQVFQKVKTKEEYLGFVARLILHIQEMNSKGKAPGMGGPAAGGGQNMQDPINALQTLARQGMAPSPRTSLNTPGQPTPSPHSQTEEQAYQAMVRLLRMYIDPLAQIIACMGNEDSENLSRLKKLVEILSKPLRKRMSLEALGKCVVTLEKLIHKRDVPATGKSPDDHTEIEDPDNTQINLDFLDGIEDLEERPETAQTPVFPVPSEQMTPPCKKRRLSEMDKIDGALEKLEKVIENRASTSIPQMDEVDVFGKYVATQIREIPLLNRLKLQEKIQTLISKERLQLLEGPSAAPMLSASSANLNQGSGGKNSENIFSGK